MVKIKLSGALKLIDNNRGHIMTARTLKRTTGEIRVMTFRQGVKKFLRGGKPAYNAGARGLLWVADMALIKAGNPKPYRSIAVEGLQSIRVAGVDYEVVR